MSKLVIGPADGNEGNIAVGKKIKMAAKYYSSYGIPTNKKIDWKITYFSDQSLQDKVSIDKNGTISVGKNITPPSDSYINVQAVAQDGSGVTSGTYTLHIRPNYLTARIVYVSTNSYEGFIIQATTEKTSPGKPSWDNADWQWVPDYCTATISGPKYSGLSKKRGSISGKIYAVYSPVPIKWTNTNLDYIPTMNPRELDKMVLTIKLKDGSNLTAKKTIYSVNYIDSKGNPSIGYFE